MHPINGGPEGPRGVRRKGEHVAVGSDGLGVPETHVDGVRALERGFAVLRCFTEGSPRLSAAKLAATTGLDRATVRRYLSTLQRLDYIGYAEDRYFLLPRVLELGWAYLGGLGLPSVANSFLARLAEQVGESCAVTILDRAEVMYVAVANAPRDLAINLKVGKRLPAISTAMGRVLLGALDPSLRPSAVEAALGLAQSKNGRRVGQDILDLLEVVHRQGWALVDQETEQGIRSVAVAVRRQGAVVGALSVSAPASRMTVSTLVDKVVPEVILTAREIGFQLVQ